MRQAFVLLLCVVLAMPGCAAVTRSERVAQPNPSRRVDPALMADYVRQLPIGSRVKISRVDGTVTHGTLMKRDADPIVVQRRARLPEEPVTIPVRDILVLELEKKAGRPHDRDWDRGGSGRGAGCAPPACGDFLGSELGRTGSQTADGRVAA